MPSIIVFSFGIFLVALVLSNFATIRIPSKSSEGNGNNPLSPIGDDTYRVRHGGLVIFTHASSGYNREAAIALASAGVHVLAGVQTKAQLRSFAYEQQKGLEPIILDITDQETVLKLFYRVRDLSQQYGKEIVAVVIDGTDNVPLNRPINWSTEVDQADEFIKSGFRTVAKFIQACLVLVSEINSSRQTRFVFQANSQLFDRSNNCGSNCIVHQTFRSLLLNLRDDVSTRMNTSATVFYIDPSASTTSPSDSVKDIFGRIQWEVSDEDTSSSDQSDWSTATSVSAIKSPVTKHVVHSVLATSVAFDYHTTKPINGNKNSNNDNNSNSNSGNDDNEVCLRFHSPIREPLRRLATKVVCDYMSNKSMCTALKQLGY